jgi:hypothetical protein
MDEERYERDLREAARERGEHRFRDMDRDMRGASDFDREPPAYGYRPAEREDRDGRRGHYNLAALYDLDDLSALRERYREHRHEHDEAPHYGHGPGIENMEAPRLGYSTGMTRRGNTDHELGHGGYIGEAYSARAPRPSGRGPKGYQRSDERIREDICDRLMMSWMNSENVDVLVRDGEVTLQGTVRSRDEKRAIEALSESVLGVKDIINALRVDRGERMSAEARPEPPGDRPLHS